MAHGTERPPSGGNPNACVPCATGVPLESTPSPSIGGPRWGVQVEPTPSGISILMDRDQADFIVRILDEEISSLVICKSAAAAKALLMARGIRNQISRRSNSPTDGANILTKNHT